MLEGSSLLINAKWEGEWGRRRGVGGIPFADKCQMPVHAKPCVGGKVNHLVTAHPRSEEIRITS